MARTTCAGFSAMRGSCQESKNAQLGGAPWHFLDGASDLIGEGEGFKHGPVYDDKLVRAGEAPAHSSRGKGIL